jgi:hypothetical protein
MRVTQFFYRRWSLMSDTTSGWAPSSKPLREAVITLGLVGMATFLTGMLLLAFNWPGTLDSYFPMRSGSGSVQGLVCGFLMALTGALMVLGDLLAVGVAAGVVVANGVRSDGAPTSTPDDTKTQLAPVA